MSVNVLGLSCFYHDAAAAIVRDGEIVAAAQEERFSRKKHDPRFPGDSINYCLEEAFIEPDELDAVVFYDSPVLSFDRVVKTVLTVVPEGAELWQKAAPSFLGVKLYLGRYLRGALGRDVPLLFSRHHLTHAASAFYPSPFDDAAILTVDGVGEWATTSISHGEGARIRPLKEIHFPHSLGLLYSAFTYFCGFKVNSGEYKLMGLAPYGKPRYADQIRAELIAFRPDGSFRLNLHYFDFLKGEHMTSSAFDDLFGGGPRSPEARITQREMDLAASVQQVTEEALLGLARHCKEITGSKNLCMAGGVALNCVANGLLVREKLFERLWIQPAAGDAGGALGAALLASYRRFGVKRRASSNDRQAMKAGYLGPAYSGAEIQAFLDCYDYPYEEVANRTERAQRIAQALADGKVVGFFNGRMEFGPRALGARSILGNPQNPETQVDMNLKIKYRESFRPFAPSVLAERQKDYFDLDVDSPYMLLVAPVVEAKRRNEGTTDAGEDLLARVRQMRSDIPAVTHVDYSARIQTVSRDESPEYHAVISAFERLTGCPVVVNTSFNVRGEPIVCSPEDAYRCFMRTEMDLLVLGSYLLEKTAQPRSENDDDWRDKFELD